MSELSVRTYSNALQTSDTDVRIQKAQWYVGGAMSSCLALWFAPFVSGIACSLIEEKLVKETLNLMGCYSKDGAEKVLWFFREKTFFLFGATYLPIAGVPLQLFETYGLGQFAIHCALSPDMLIDEVWLQQSWKEVEPDVFSGNHAVQFYEQFTGESFPEDKRGTFLAAVECANQAYLASQKFPGAAKAQEKAGKAAHWLVRKGKTLASGIGKAAAIGLGGAIGVGLEVFDTIAEKRKQDASSRSARDQPTPPIASTRGPETLIQLDYTERVFAQLDAERTAKEVIAAAEQTESGAHYVSPGTFTVNRVHNKANRTTRQSFGRKSLSRDGASLPVSNE